MNHLIGIALGVLATWLGICAVIVVAVLRSKAHDSVWEDERPEWADDPTPLYDRLVCEQMEKAEGWVR